MSAREQPPPPRSTFRLALRALMRDRLALAGVIVLLAVAFAAIFAPWISPYDPDMPTRAVRRLMPPLTSGHLLGTDGQSRDVLSRLIWGARIALPVAFIPIIVSSVLGLALGILAGFLRGITGAVVMRILDVIFAFPGVLLAVAIAAILGPGIANAAIAMSIVLLPFVARIVYVETTQLAEADFVAAAYVTGSGTLEILLRDILPNVLSPVIVFGTTSLGAMIVLEAGLSFLGVGVQPPTADWGVMAAEGRTVLANAPWISVIPGLVIVAVAVACNFAGDGLRDALDPRQRTRN